MRYECPDCKLGATLTENIHLGGSEHTCRCGKVSVIPLYCPKCYPATADKKEWMQTPRGELGGRQFTCSRNHTFIVPVRQASVHAKLSALGNEVGQYHQGARIAKIQDTDLKAAVSAGFCAGVCFDWIRRVLVSRVPKLAHGNQGERLTEAFDKLTPEERQTFKEGPKFETVLDRIKHDRLQDHRTALIHQAIPNPAQQLEMGDKYAAARLKQYKEDSEALEKRAEELLETSRSQVDSQKIQAGYEKAERNLQQAYNKDITAPAMERIWAQRGFAAN